MNKLHTAVLFLFTSLLSCMTAFGQDGPIQGVVWQQPDDLQQAIADLYAIRRAGMQAVRTSIIANEQLLTVADGLGIQVFQELPIENLPAADLGDTLAFASRVLDQVLVRAREHPSARHFGLARLSDTSSPAACAYFEQLTERVHQSGPSGARAYYITPFESPDACASTVDLVLLNALEADNPAALLERWTQQDSGRIDVGIAALGSRVDDEAKPGLGSPYSRESQARYLETNLNRLLGKRASVQPYAVFVFRWRDPVDLGGPEAEREHPVPVTFGLLDGEEARPALSVVRGIYTGEQMVFAFEQGEESPRGWPWATLLGWGGIAVLGVFYAASPRLRFMVPRYFGAHGFYRDAVREGRDVLLGSSAVLLFITALATGILWSAVLNVYATEEGLLMLLRWVGEPIRSVLIAAQSYPWVAVLVFAGIFVASALVWALVLAIASHRRYALAPSQTLMLVAWPRWSLLLMLPAAMVIPTLDHATAETVCIVLVGVWIVIMLYAVIRTAYDFHAVTRVPIYITLVVWFASPFIILLLLLTLAVLFNLPEATFLYHLATRA